MAQPAGVRKLKLQLYANEAEKEGPAKIMQ